jgi:hypothetical protein
VKMKLPGDGEVLVSDKVFVWYLSVLQFSFGLWVSNDGTYFPDRLLAMQFVLAVDILVEAFDACAEVI